MAKTIMLNSRFWEDNYISELDPSEKLLFVYFLTNPRVSLSGIYEVPLPNVALDTGLDRKAIEIILKRFEMDRKMVYLGGWLCMINYPKHQNYESPLIVKGVENEFKQMPVGLLDEFVKGYGYPIDTLYIGLKGKGKGKEQDKGKEDKEGFDVFWSAYPKKIAKPVAERAFSKASDPLEVILAGLEKWKKTEQWQKDKGKYIPYPATWLNQKRWKDEVEVNNGVKNRFHGL